MVRVLRNVAQHYFEAVAVALVQYAVALVALNTLTASQYRHEKKGARVEGVAFQWSKFLFILFIKKVISLTTKCLLEEIAKDACGVFVCVCVCLFVGMGV